MMKHNLGSGSGNDSANSVNASTSLWSDHCGNGEFFLDNLQTTSENQEKSFGNSLSFSNFNDPVQHHHVDSSAQPPQTTIEELPLRLSGEQIPTIAGEFWSDNGLGGYNFQNAETDIQNLSGRLSSGDNWSCVSDALGNAWNSASVSPAQSFRNLGSTNTPLASSSSQDFWEITLRDIIRDFCDQEDGICITNDPSAPVLPATNTHAGNQQAEKRKGSSSPSNLSDKPMSSETDGDDSYLSEESSGDKKKPELDVEEPETGMVFLSEGAAYEFYKHYASQIGFRVRKGKVQRLADQTIRKRLFYCSKQGFRSKQQSNKITKYTRKETRTGCEAMIQLTVEEEKWVISKVVLDHNHDLPDSRGRPVHARDSVQTRTNVANEIGLSRHIGLSSMVDRDFIQDKKSSNLQAEDCRTLEKYLSNLQEEDQSFFVELQVDHGGKQMPNFFWRDSRSKMDYYCFGDVLVLDTAFRMDKYDMICVAFFGINHHQQHILFGCAFLIDETKETLVWLLRIFMEAMGRREPKTIFTDEGQDMADSIKLVLPQTQHCIGTWCICQNAKKHLPKHYEQPGFKSLFNRCMFDCRSREEFEESWNSLLKKYKLRDNSWFQTLYRLRHQWSHIFCENAFSAGIQLVQGTENMINVFQDMTSEMSLQDFAQQYQKSAERMRREETSEDFRCLQSAPVMILRSNIEKEAADVYTSTVFKIFQEELRRCLSVKIEEKQSDGTTTTFLLLEEGDKREYTIAFNNSDSKITCDCGKFESIGVLCVHALKVLNRQNIFDIPHQYILNRWRKDAKTRVLMDAAEAADKRVSPLNSTANKLALELFNIIAKSAGNDECLKLVGTCFDKVAKEVDKMMKSNPVEHLNSKDVEAGEFNSKAVPRLLDNNQTKGSKGKGQESFRGHKHCSDVKEITSEYGNGSQAPLFSKSISASQDSKMSSVHAKVSATRNMPPCSYHSLSGSREGMVSKVRSTAAKIIRLGPMGKKKGKTPI